MHENWSFLINYERAQFFDMSDIKATGYLKLNFFTCLKGIVMTVHQKKWKTNLWLQFIRDKTLY